MTPDTTERELDEFCAVKVMGYTRMSKRVKLTASEGRTLYSDGVIYKWLDDHGPHSECWNPTENGGQALQVLQECMRHCGKPGGTLRLHFNGQSGFGISNDEHRHFTFEAPIERSICDFARKLFSQREGGG